MQAEFLVELEENADRLEIPWEDAQNPAHRFLDLKTEPALLEEVVEARNSPPLRRFLAAVNAQDTVFATAKCDVWETGEFSPRERSAFPQALTKFAGYVDICFSKDDFNFDRGHYEQLGRRLIPLLTAAPVSARVELCLRHCWYRANKAWGFYLTAFLYGYGRDAAEAEKEWTAGILALESALLRVSSALRQALRQTEG